MTRLGQCGLEVEGRLLLLDLEKNHNLLPKLPNIFFYLTNGTGVSVAANPVTKRDILSETKYVELVLVADHQEVSVSLKNLMTGDNEPGVNQMLPSAAFDGGCAFYPKWNILDPEMNDQFLLSRM
ncbi:hypothetical protein XENOCAPTIV_030502, partial [Xenoophorus captivus]